MFSSFLKTLSFTPTNGNLYAYAGNNPVKYTDPDGKYIVFKLKENGQYGLGSYYHNVGYCHLVTKVLTNFVPFGGYILNLEQPLTNIDPTANFTVLYDSDSTSSIVNESNIVDSVSFTKAAKSSKFFGYASWIYTVYGVKSSINDFKNDRKIEKFMASLSKDPFRGCLSDSAAINLGQTLADGALYYYENESRMKQKGISETDWAEKIRSSTNNIWGNAKFKTFEELENI